jgi:hypothetical protein
MRERPLVIPRAAIFVLVPASAAGTHVHQITPLLQCSLIPATRRQTRPTSKRRNRDWLLNPPSRVGTVQTREREQASPSTVRKDHRPSHAIPARHDTDRTP